MGFFKGLKNEFEPAVVHIKQAISVRAIQILTTFLWALTWT